MESPETLDLFLFVSKIQAMRAGILSVARKALDGCLEMNTLAAQVAADLGYATEAQNQGALAPTI